MLLRGDRVSKSTDHVTPQEARGTAPLAVRDHEADRAPRGKDAYRVRRDPARAARLLQQACERGAHVPSCHNLAVMYAHGDDGVPADPVKAESFKRLTEDTVSRARGY